MDFPTNFMAIKIVRTQDGLSDILMKFFMSVSPTLRQTSTGLTIHVTFLALKILTLLHSEWPKLHRGLKCKKYPVACTDQISKV